MGGYDNQQQNKKKSSSSPFAVFNFLKGKKGSQKKVDQDSSWDDSFNYWSSDDSFKYYKVWRSDEDRGGFVAKPGIDREATAYIAKIYAATSEYSTGEHNRQ